MCKVYIYQHVYCVCKWQRYLHKIVEKLGSQVTCEWFYNPKFKFILFCRPYATEIQKLSIKKLISIFLFNFILSKSPYVKHFNSQSIEFSIKKRINLPYKNWCTTCVRVESFDSNFLLNFYFVKMFVLAIWNINMFTRFNCKLINY